MAGKGIFRLIAGAATTALLWAGGAQAAVINGGVYQLHNHPDAARQPPPYGLRLDELYNVDTGDVDRFTFDFDHALSDVRLAYNTAADSIHIYGRMVGGRDLGTDWAVDQYLGLYYIDFTYSVGVTGVPGDDDIWVGVWETQIKNSKKP